MRLSLLILLVVGTAAVVVSAQNRENRRPGRPRFRALAEAARNGDPEAQEKIRSLRRNRTRSRQGASRSSAVPSRPTFQDAVQAPVEPQEPIRVRVPVRRTRVRVPRPTVEVTTFRPTTLFSPTPTPEQVFLDTEETILATNPFTEAPVFEQQFSTEPFIESPTFRSVVEETPAPRRHRFRQPSQAVSQSEDDFSINFNLEPHRALNTGLEVGSRSEHIIPRFGTDRTTVPPVETIRRYSYFDEQGNYVFGYEADDGSFKEEIRGLDCVVNGKYGYVDPDGVRREFTYTSGNKCDPNAVVDPETQEVPVLPLNDQFLQQTQEQQLTEAELDVLHFNRRRRPVPTRQPQQQTIASETRRRPQPQARPSSRPVTQLASRPTTRPTPRPATRPAPRPATRPAPRPATRPAPRPATRPAPRPIQEPQPVFRPVTEAPVTQAPAPVFTTPASFNRFTTPASFRRAQGRLPAQEQEVARPRPVFPPEQEVLIRRPAQPSRAPVQEQPIEQRRPTHQAFQPPEGPALRPTPKPIAFNFDREFNNLFSNFAAPRPTTRRPAPIPRPRPTPPPTSRPPPPPPPPPPTKRPTFRPVSTAPVPTRPSLDDGSRTLGGGRDVANQLVFDVASGTFTNVPVKTGSSRFLPQPAPNPFAPRPFQPSPTPSIPTHAPPPPRPFSPSPSPSTGRPLPQPTHAPTFNPASHFVINQNGRSPAAAEFDKFFSQFNLNF